MIEIYNFIKENCDLPLAVFQFTIKDGVNKIDPFKSINFDLRGESDEDNIQKMEEIVEHYGEDFMFFNNSLEGIEFFENNPITFVKKGVE